MNYPIRSAGLFLLIAVQACAPIAAADDLLGKQCAPEIVALVGQSYPTPRYDALR